MKHYPVLFAIVFLLGFGAKGQQVKHLVLFKLKSGIGKTDPRVLDGMAQMKNIQKLIPEIKSLECGLNFSDRPIAYDIGLYTVFKNREDLATYLKHPAHQQLSAYWKALAEWNIADFEW